MAKLGSKLPTQQPTTFEQPATKPSSHEVTPSSQQTSVQETSEVLHEQAELIAQKGSVSSWNQLRRRKLKVGSEKPKNASHSFLPKHQHLLKTSGVTKTSEAGISSPKRPMMTTLWNFVTENIFRPSSLFSGIKAKGNGAEVRQWYLQEVDKIKTLQPQWQAMGLSPKEQATKAHSIRKEARIQARSMMSNRRSVLILRLRDRWKYGNPNGPTLSHLVKKLEAKGLSRTEAYQAIVQSSTKTSKKFTELSKKLGKSAGTTKGIKPTT